jgi:beta-phosphoglucomutase-like phosphatase (HAD superfamily)
MTPRLIIDMDNTLYPSPFARVCHKLYGVPTSRDVELRKWEWHKDYGLTDDQFYAAVNIVHAAQLDYEPFEGAVEALQDWEHRGLHITIATHRRPELAYFTPLLEWLWNKGIPYDAIYMGLHGKEVMFGPDVIVIDDRPSTIQAAVEANCFLTATLAHPYVKKTVDDFFPYAVMGETWSEIRNLVNARLNLREDGVI